MVKLIVAIMHASFNPERRGMVIDLVRRLGGKTGGGLADVRIVEDKVREGPWPTARRCLLEGLRGDATHLLLMQDDVRPCRDFLRGVHEAAKLRPEETISFFTNAPEMEKAKELGVSWVKSFGNGLWTMALLLPVSRIAEILRWQDQHIARHAPHDDLRLLVYHLLTSTAVYFTAPSLVEHVGWNQSLLGHRNKKETHTARWYIGDEKSALTIDYRRGLLAPVEIPISLRTVGNFKAQKWLRATPPQGGSGAAA